MSGGSPSSRICSHGAAPLVSSLLTASTTRFHFFMQNLQLPPNANKAGPTLLSLSHRSCLKAFCSRAESPPPLPTVDEEKHQTISYLVTSCGLSPDAALRATKFVTIMKRTKALAVIELLRSYGFPDAHIDRIAAKCPNLLVANPEKRLKPKLDFLLSEGFSMEDVADIFAANNSLLHRNLETGLIATYRFLSATLPSRSEVIDALKATNRCLTADHEPNIKMLRDNGVLETVIFFLVKRSPEVLMRKYEHLEEAVKTLLELGMDPKTKKFGLALQGLGYASKESWLRKLEFFQELGWSETEVISMFKKRPMVFTLNNDSLRYKVDFFIKNFGWDLEFISKNPALLQYSIEGRILPRVAILKVLMSKGLITTKWTDKFSQPEQQFFERYVNNYTAEVPGIVKMYEDAVAFKEN